MGQREKVDTVQLVGRVVETVADVLAVGSLEVLISELAAVRAKGRTMGDEGEPTKPGPSEDSFWANADLDGESGALEVGGADGKLHNCVEFDVIAVKEDSNDGVAVGREGLSNLSG